MLGRKLQQFVVVNDEKCLIKSSFLKQRKLRRMLLMLVLLTIFVTICFIIHLTMNDEQPTNIKLEVQEEAEKSGMVKNKIGRMLLDRIQTIFQQNLDSLHEILSTLKWHLLMTLDLWNSAISMNYTDDVTAETLFVYKAFLDVRRPERLIRILAFSQCRDINVILHNGRQCISAREVTVEYDCPWKWVPECRWFSFILIFNIQNTNFSAGAVSFDFF